MFWPCFLLVGSFMLAKTVFLHIIVVKNTNALVFLLNFEKKYSGFNAKTSAKS